MSGRVEVLREFIVWGPPRTKKTSNTIRRRGARRLGRCPACGQHRGTPFVGPSPAWELWLKTAQIEFEGSRFRVPEPITVPVNCRAWFFRDKKSKDRGDATGFYQGLADLLEKRGVVANDSLIRTWDGTRLKVDIDNPRTEVILESVDS